MRFYYLFLVVSVILAYLAQTQGEYVAFDDGSEEVCQKNSFFVILLLMLFCFAYSFRWKVGTDFSGYYYGYTTYGLQPLASIINGRDWAFSLLSHAIYQIAPGNYHFYFFILSLITYVPVIYFYCKYANDFDLVIFLYITNLSCFWPYNGSRQSLAVSICLLAVDLLQKRKIVCSLCLVLIAATFHSTALIVLPLLFFIRLKPWSTAMNLITFVLLLSVLFLSRLWAGIIRILERLGQDKLVTDYGNAVISTGGVNILRIVLALIPIVLALIMHFTTPELITEKNGFFINLSVLSAVFMIAAFRLTILARFSSYFSIGNSLIYNAFLGSLNQDSKKVFVILLGVCYLAYMTILLPIESNLVPFQFAL